MTVFRGAASDLRITGDSAVNYATARSTGNYSNDGDNLRVGQAYSSGHWYVYRCYLAFDTSAIPDGDTITQVDLELKVSADQSFTDFGLYLYKYNWKTVADGTGTTGDRDNVFDMGTAGATDAQAAVKETPEIATTAGVAVGGTLTFAELDTTWVNKAGTTKYALRSKRDADGSGTAPTGGENIYFYAGDNATETLRPALVVTHGSQKVQRITRIHAQGVISDSPLNQLA